MLPSQSARCLRSGCIDIVAYAENYYLHRHGREEMRTAKVVESSHLVVAERHRRSPEGQYISVPKVVTGTNTLNYETCFLDSLLQFLVVPNCLNFPRRSGKDVKKHVKKHVACEPTICLARLTGGGEQRT